MSQLRLAALGAVDAGSMGKLFRTLLRKGVAGDVAAARLVCEYVLGRPTEFDLLARLERLEQALEGTAA